MIPELARDAKREAEATNERRVLVFAGDRDRGIDAAYDVVHAIGGGGGSGGDPDGEPDDDSENGEGNDDTESDAPTVSIVSTREGFRFEEHRPRRADELLGRTRDVVVLDCHEQFVPNALGRSVGAVDGGGLLLLLTPDLDAWPGIRDRFDDSLAVPPYDVDDVTGRFRERFVDTLRTHPGLAIVALGSEPDGSDVVERDGLTRETGGVGRSSRSSTRRRPAPPPNATFPAATYEACLTDDQARAVSAFEALATPENAVVVESDRGRGKSSAAGLAAGALAAAGDDVLVTAPAFRNAAELFARAGELLGADGEDEAIEAAVEDGPRRLETPAGGRVRYRRPVEAVDLPGDPDVVVVDEAAALPVRLLEAFLDAPAVAFCTTVHGYEGAGRGFSIRFRERLLESRFTVRDVQLDEPIRYARNDPVEAWASRALMLDARPAVDEAVEGATVADATYRTLSGDELLANETLLGEAFGLLVAAHYRTEPNDLARLLDAPNLSARAIVTGDRVLAVALLAREGGLSAETRRSMYMGERVRGNMVPDLLTSQLRDERAAEPRGLRTVRIATHHAVRDRGFGSRLLDGIHAEFGDDVDYFSVGYGATPRLLRFWRRAGYRTVHLSTSRNDASGEHSAIMLRPADESGATGGEAVDDALADGEAVDDDPGGALLERHAVTFRDRERDGLSDAHRDVDPDVVAGALRACPASAPVELTRAEWRSVIGASFGPGMYDSAPGAFRDLALAALVDGGIGLDDRERRLVVRKVLQGRPWESVAEELGYVSTPTCMRALGDAYEPLVERYGSEFALAERDRFTGE